MLWGDDFEGVVVVVMMLLWCCRDDDDAMSWWWCYRVISMTMAKEEPSIAIRAALGNIAVWG